jgi:hypothetical protein
MAAGEGPGRWKLLLGYAAVGAGVVVFVAARLGLILRPADAAAVWRAGALAYAVQVVALAVLLLAGRGQAFLAAWMAGTVARLGLLLAVALWVVRTAAVPPAPLLLGLVGFLFVLMMLEGVFYRLGMRG